MRRKVVFIVGPTAVGKTKVAVKLAKRLKGEIISCDSMQVYKEMHIVSAKDKRQLKSTPCHLIDAVSVKEDFNVASYCRLAKKKITEIHKLKKVPLIVGGSGLYVSSLLDGIFLNSKNSPALRKRLYNEAEKFGTKRLYNKLRKVDNVSAGKIHPHDLRRIVRAIEVFTLTGKPISFWQRQRKGITEKYRIWIFGLCRERSSLYERIEKRTDKMFRDGLVKEVKRLLRLPLSKTAQQVLGIKEIRGYINKQYDLKEARYLLKRNSRHYAKRQMSWFKRDKRIYWVKIKDKDSLAKTVNLIVSNLKHNGR